MFRPALRLYRPPDPPTHPHSCQFVNRRAVPVLLPYHTELDSLTWWASEVLFDWYFAFCIHGGSAQTSLRVYSGAQSHDANYTRIAISDGLVEETFRKSHPALAERFIDARRREGLSIWSPLPYPPPHVIDLRVDSIPDWRNSSNFAFCVNERSRVFNALIARGFPEAASVPNLDLRSDSQGPKQPEGALQV